MVNKRIKLSVHRTKRCAWALSASKARLAALSPALRRSFSVSPWGPKSSQGLVCMRWPSNSPVFQLLLCAQNPFLELRRAHSRQLCVRWYFAVLQHWGKKLVAKFCVDGRERLAAKKELFKYAMRALVSDGLQRATGSGRPGA